MCPAERMASSVVRSTTHSPVPVWDWVQRSRWRQLSLCSNSALSGFVDTRYINGFGFRWTPCSITPSSTLRNFSLIDDDRIRHHFSCCLFQQSLWSSGQSFWLQIQKSRVRFPALPDFQSSSGSGTGPTQPREFNWGATWIKSSGSGL